MFREPLEPSYDKGNEINKDYLSEIDLWMKKTSPYCNLVKTIKKCENYPDDIILKIISDNNKGLISVGKLSSDEDRESILKLFNVLRWPIYADITSGLRFKSLAGTNIIKHFDMNIMSPELCMAAKPEAVLHLGGRITSKRFFEFLKTHRPNAFINVKNDASRYNPEHLASITIEAEICNFCDDLTDKIRNLKQKEDLYYYRRLFSK